MGGSACSGAVSETDLVSYLQHGTIVGLIPTPQPLASHRIIISAALLDWLTSYTLGMVYVHSLAPPLWHGTEVRLFHVRETP